MKISGAKVYTEEHVFAEKDIFISGDRIVSSDAGGPVIDAKGLFAVPGLVDIHLHGAAGHDFCEGTREALDAVTEYEASRGVLALCPTTMSLPAEKILPVLKALGSYENDRGSCIAGIDLEGPFLDPAKAGAQDPENVIPFDGRLLSDLQDAAGGKIRIVALAPECMPDMSEISVWSEKLHISLAHTNCDYDTAKKAFGLGADHLTHCFNAMNGIGHRAPGPIPAAMEAGAFAEIIADGVHIHPSVVKLAIRMFGEDRTVFVSDSMMAAGMPDGVYELGGQKVTVSEGRAFLASDPSVIAGGAADLFECFRRAVAMDISLETALRCVCENPAKSIGIEKDFGTLSAGSLANILLLDDELNIREIILKGKAL